MVDVSSFQTAAYLLRMNSFDPKLGYQAACDLLKCQKSIPVPFGKLLVVFDTDLMYRSFQRFRGGLVLIGFDV